MKFTGYLRPEELVFSVKLKIEEIKRKISLAHPGGGGI